MENYICFKRVLNIDELVSYTGWSKGSIHNLISKREIPHSKPFGNGGKVFFERELIENWLLENRIETIRELEKRI